MTEEEFSTLDTQNKWIHLKRTVDYISQMDSMYEMRRRLNPHHPKSDVDYETRNVRVEQYQRWAHVKNLYAAHRDELSNTLSNSDYEEIKNIMERTFTAELDEALRSVIDN